MNIQHLIKKLKGLEVHLALKGDQLMVDAPKGVLTEDLLAEIGSQKKEILRYLGEASQEKFESIPRAAEQADYALSHAQRRIWVMHELDPSQISYNVSFAFWMRGKLNLDAFTQAFDTLLARHEILRTGFVMVGDNPRQKIMAVEELGPQTGYLELEGEIEEESVAMEAALKEASTPFDLRKAPLIRSKLLRFSAEKHLYLLTLHHIISDGWSNEVLVQELSVLYTAFCKGAPNPLPALSIQYKDYASWQNAQFEKGSFEALRSYWLTQFQDKNISLDLPGDYPRPQVKTYNGADILTHLSKESSTAILGYVQTKKVSLYMYLLAALDVLLYRYTGQNELVIACPIAGREHRDLEKQIGFYINTLPILVELSGEDTFVEVLDRTKGATMGAYSHQSYPFDLLIEELELERDLSRSPLVDVMLTLQNTELTQDNALELEGIQLESLEYEHLVSKFDWAIGVDVEEGIIAININYDRDIYSSQRMERVLDHYCRLLSNLMAAENIPLDALSYLSEAERSLLVETFNDTNHAFESEQTLVSLFTNQVSIRPEAIAIVDQDEQYTYQALDQWSDRIAIALRDQYGVGREDLVGLLVDRSAWMVAGIMGILKAGAAFLPLGIDNPSNRLKSILADARPQVVLVDSPEDLAKHGITGYTTLVQQSLAELSDLGASHRLERPLMPENLAYVIYTSGSTGTPKGVMIEHRGVINRIEWMKNQYGVGEDDIILQKTPYTFDVSIWEFFLPLSYGARLVTCRKEEIYDPKVLAELIAKEQVSLLHFVPSMYQHFLDSLDPQDIGKIVSLKGVFCSGEALTREIVQKHAAILDIPLHNLYGPTEATVDVSYYETQLEDLFVPIGQPIWNTDLYVVGVGFDTQAIGFNGEIVIGGVGLARGYLNRPELTAERFVDSPFKQGEKVYLTGDIGYWREDGQIQYLGRKDNQVKLRGYRIELGEIEHAISQVHSQGQVMVQLQKDARQDGFLVAYLTTDHEVSLKHIKQGLQEKIPSYMIPDFFVFLDQFPRTSSGKIDRKKLSLIRDYQQTKEEKVPPRNKQEETLVSIWKEVLDQDEIGITDDFFELGGHSLKAIKVLSRIQKEFHSSIRLRDLFRYPTIEALIEIIISGVKKTYTSIVPIEKSPDYALSHAQSRIWVIHQLNPLESTFNMPFACRLNGQIKISLLERVFQTLIERHESLRTAFIQVEGKPRQIILAPEQILFAIRTEDIRETENQDAHIKKVIKLDTKAPFDLSQGPLLRVSILQVDYQEYLFVLTMHHIICDAWSIEVMVGEIQRLYNSYAKNTPNLLGDLSIQYKDFAHWQNEKLLNGELDLSERYWTERFSNISNPINLPFAEERPLNKSFNGDRLEFLLSKELQKGLKSLLGKYQLSEFILLLTAVYTLLYRYTRQNKMTIGTTVAARDHLSLESQIGFFVNTLALDTTIEESDSFQSLLQKVKNISLSALEHQNYPFDVLVDRLDIPRELNRSPLFDILVELVNTDSTVKKTDETLPFEIEPFELEVNTTQYDLSFRFIEGNEQLTLILEYSTDLYQKSDIEQLLTHFTLILEQITRDIHTPISKLVTLSQEERNQQLYQFNQTEVEQNISLCIHEYIEEKALNASDSQALSGIASDMTYQELIDASNRLAQHLRNHLKISRQEKVGILMNPSEYAVVAMLAILKSGATFLPIDPSHPTGRKDYILKDASVNVLLTDPNQLHQIDFFNGTVLIPELELFALPDLGPKLSNINHSEDIAYIIYTSGSTGYPKGVEIKHKSLINYINWANRFYFNNQKGHTFALFSSLAFDLTLTSIFTTLFRGDCIAIIDKNNVHEQLEKVFNTDSVVNTVKLTPSHINALEFLALESTNIKNVIIGGEALTRNHCEILYKLNSEINIFNEYGPTEATIGCAATQIRRNGKPITIGKPIDNTQIYVVDDRLNLLPIGAVGEICIGGVGLAHAYLNKPSLTKDKFVDNPFGLNSSKFYLSGDLGRWRKDGTIEFLGRKDDQLKIRGHRIEVGEIEYQLCEIDHIKDALVSSWKDSSEQEALVAYLLTQEKIDFAQIKNTLRVNLPEYMIPTYYVSLSQFPLTTNGKIDRKHLPEPEAKNVGGSTEYKAPKNQVEGTLVRIWQKVLEREQISTTDNFFDIGGNSLKLVEMYAELESEFGSNIHIPDLFKYTTIESLQTRLTSVENTQGSDFIEV